MNGKYKLPIQVPLIKTYLEYAHCLAVAQCDYRVQEYLLFYFLQLHTTYNSDRSSIKVDFFVNDGVGLQCPFIQKRIASHSDEVSDVCGAVAELLATSSYVEIILDETFLPMKSRYRQTDPFFHPTLIYGVDGRAEIFFAQGYLADGQYEAFQLPFSAVRAAFRDGSQIREIRIDNNFTWAPAAELRASATAHLRDYLAGECSCKKVEKPPKPGIWQRFLKAPINNADGLFGVSVFRFIFATLKNHNGYVSDIRSWCLLWEHKQRIVALAEYLVPYGLNGKVVIELRNVEKEFYLIRNDIMEAWYSKQKIDVDVLRERVSRILKTEGDVLPALISAL